MHHDFYAIAQEHQNALVRIMDNLGVIACLSGHTHKISQRKIDLPSGRTIPNFVCGKTLNQRGDIGSDNRIIVYEWNLNEKMITAKPYRWASNRFEPSFDYNTDEQAQKNVHGYSFSSLIS